MRDSVHSIIERYGRFLRFIPGLKTVILPFYGKYAKWRRNRIFNKYGISVLKEFDEVMLSNNIHYSVFAGTLLGAIREQGLLKHDLDLDVVMFNSNYSFKIQEILNQNGFHLLHAFTVADGALAREETYIKNGVSIDIYYVYSDAQFPTYQCDFHGEKGSSDNEDSMKKFGYVCVRRLEFPVSTKVRRAPFEGIYVNVLENAEEWLSYRYGSNYMVPDPGFKDKGDNPFIYEWEGVKGIMTCY